ncbi:MAG: efflux RND transporter permease subunit [Oligoflexales bacterium]|nr:efflux RND transporter permease subunit [Oligoflexales bacterium]
MFISELSIKKPVFAWMLMSFLIIFGGISFTRMGISQLPDVDFPVVTIRLSLPGAAPEVMERDVVDVVENAVMSIQGVKHVTSVSKNGSATVTVQLDISRSIDLAVQDVQSKIAEALKKLPKQMDPPVITKTNPEDQPIMWITLESDVHSLRDLMIYVQDHLQQEFLTTPDVGDINLGGYIAPALRVWVSNEKLRKYELTVHDVIAAITKEHGEPPAGWLNEHKREYNVRTLGEAISAEELGKIFINTRGGAPNFTPIPLSKVAYLDESLDDIRRISRGNGKPAVGLGIKKQRGANAVAVAQATRNKIKTLEKTLPKGMQLGLNFDSTKFIEEAVADLNWTLLLSALLTALVCWLFLGSWSSTFNVLLSIPTSIVGSFIFLSFSGFTLNTFTLLGLSLAIGIVVDDSIMVLENIIRHREMGKSRLEAALVGSREITFAAIATTMSIIAIFLPVAFMEGIIGRFFLQFGVTMTVAVLLSLVEALTITPMRCSQFLNVEERTTIIGRSVEAGFHALKEFYKKSLSIALRFRWLVISLSLVFFSLSFMTLSKINKEFIPPEDQSRFMVKLKTPIGSALSYTDEKMKLIEDFLSKRSEVIRYYATIGGFGGGEVNSGMVFVTLKPKGERGIEATLGHEGSQAELMTIFREELNKTPDVKVTMQDLSMRGFTASRGFPLEFTIQGPDWDKLGELTKLVMDELKKSGLVTDLDTDYLTGMPELQIIPKRARASAMGVSVADIGSTINALIGGLVVSTYPRGGHRDDIKLKLLEDEQGRTDKINKIYVRNNRGELIRLQDLVEIKEKSTLSSVSRSDRSRAVTVFGNITKGKSQQDALNAVKTVSQNILPPGYNALLTGSSEDFKNTFKSLLWAFILGLIVAYMVLASQFNSFIDPITVMMALPFSISGAFLALLVTNQSLNMYSMIGLLLLMGIVKKNSILLVDFTNQARAEGKNVSEALLAACPNRLRPILMTSIATIVGALPAAFAWGAGAETRKPMAVAVIGGVLLSTILTLYIVPCVYSLMTRLEQRKFNP